MRLPDYIIIGAMKCGTSTLAAQLGAQHRVFMTTPKEPNFFSDDPVFAKGINWYHSLFDGAKHGDLKGEASTHYTKLHDLPDTLPRLRATFNHSPRLIYLIRDPLARAVSHYIHEWTMGVITTDLASALDTHPALVDYGRYGMQLAPWVETFGTEAIHVDTLEAMYADPAALMLRIGHFLGRSDLRWKEDTGPQNVSSERLQRRALDGLLINNPVATMLRRKLIPQALRDKIKAGRQMKKRPEIGPDHIARLKAIFAEDRTILHALLPGRSDLDVAYQAVLS
ncbi:sulfotransferase domain-containing protein [Tateyamaria sp. ANG-S1]|uniref:sulfotransferase domain-containing protein n=1 Tax=Tateyamaria sp. ANG-S1 TaxID=1577905 RepID=UPI00057D81FE|nr:sulfotransferase domain-containing protein [Tateyamaria sp. ANG-S1]KIC45477.1 sulfotransferase [Tateyamaria sp. ANG-S1]